MRFAPQTTLPAASTLGAFQQAAAKGGEKEL
jgi:hypothetical protein